MSLRDQSLADQIAAALRDSDHANFIPIEESGGCYIIMAAQKNSRGEVRSCKISVCSPPAGEQVVVMCWGRSENESAMFEATKPDLIQSIRKILGYPSFNNGKCREF